MNSSAELRVVQQAAAYISWQAEFSVRNGLSATSWQPSPASQLVLGRLAFPPTRLGYSRSRLVTLFDNRQQVCSPTSQRDARPSSSLGPLVEQVAR